MTSPIGIDGRTSAIGTSILTRRNAGLRRRLSRVFGGPGFTLIEVLLTVAILSISAAFMYQGNWQTLDAYGRYVRRLCAQNWAEEKIWGEKEKIVESPTVEVGDSSGTFSYRKRNYSWSLNVDSAGRSGLLYSVELVVSWPESGRTVEMKRFSFVRKPQVSPAGI